MQDDTYCYHCQALRQRTERMASRLARYGQTTPDETALLRLSYHSLVSSITKHWEEVKHYVDFSAPMIAVLRLPFEG